MIQFQKKHLFLTLPFLSLFFFLHWKEVIFYLSAGMCIAVAFIISAAAVTRISMLQYFQIKARHLIFFKNQKEK